MGTKELKKDLIASIMNERRKFDMSRWTKDGNRATCGTALCMAGHLEAIRPKVAKAILVEHPEWGGDEWRGLEHELLANAIWEKETGEKCRLDFVKENTSTDIEELTREDAVKHINGRHRSWPLNPR